MGDLKFTCLACGHRTLATRCDWDICPVCLWEDDVTLSESDKDKRSPANGDLLLSEAQINFIQLGAITKDALKYCRKANSDEPLDEGWAPLARTADILAAGRLK